MVVVAIIGILAAVAIPLYSKYAARARQSEAKVALATIHVSQKSYYLEQGTYSACLAPLGYAPEGFVVAGLGSKRFYAVGFAAAPPAACGPTATQSCLGYMYPPSGAPTVGCAYTDGQAYFDASVAEFSGGAPATNAQIPATAITQVTFLIGAAGNISTTSTTYDQWTIDQNKKLQNVFSSL